MNMQSGDDAERGTGRSTGLILQSISHSILSPGVPVIFRDHFDAAPSQAFLWRKRIIVVLRTLHLTGISVQPLADGTVRLIYYPGRR